MLGVSEVFLIAALAVPAQGVRVPYKTEDVLIRFLRECVPPGNRDGCEPVLYVWVPIITFHELYDAAAKVCPGGYLVANISRSKGFSQWLEWKGWQIMPFYFKDMSIHRKPLTPASA